MELAAAVVICGAIGGLGYVLLTVWFKKYEAVLEARQEKSLLALKDLLSEHALSVSSKQQELLEHQTAVLRSQQAEINKMQAELIKIVGANSPSQTAIDLGPLRELIEHNSRIAEVQVITQLLPLLAPSAETKKAIELAASFIDNREIVQEIQRLAESPPARIVVSAVEAAPAQVPEIRASERMQSASESVIPSAAPSDAGPSLSGSASVAAADAGSTLVSPSSSLSPSAEAAPEASAAASQRVSSSVPDLSPEEHAAQMLAKQMAEVDAAAAAGWVSVPLGQLAQKVQTDASETPAVETDKLTQEAQAKLENNEEQAAPKEMSEEEAAAQRLFGDLQAAESSANEGGLFSLSDEEMGGIFGKLLANTDASGIESEQVVAEQSSPEPEPAEASFKAGPEAGPGQEANEADRLSKQSEEEAAAARIFGAREESQINEPAGLLSVSEDELGEVFDKLFSEDSSEKAGAKPEPQSSQLHVQEPESTNIEPKAETSKLRPASDKLPGTSQASSSLRDPQKQKEEEEAALRLFGTNEAKEGALFNLSDQDLAGMFDELVSEDSQEKKTAVNPVQKFEEEREKRRLADLAQRQKLSRDLEQTGPHAVMPGPLLPEKTQEEEEAEARLFGNLFGDAPNEKDNEAEKRRLAEEAEKRHLAEEAEKRRLAEEAEKKRQAEEEAEKKRQAEEEEKKRQAEEEEKTRKQTLSEDLEDTLKMPESAHAGMDNKQLAMEAAERKLAALAGMSGRAGDEAQAQFEQRRDEEAVKLLEESERQRPAEVLDPATERLLAMEAIGALPAAPLHDSGTNFDHPTVEQPFSEAFVQDGNRLYEQGKYAEADKHYRAALPTLEEVMGREHLAVVEILHKLALIAVRRGKYVEGEETFQQALVRRVIALGGNHPDTVATLNDLGELYLKRANYNEARKVFAEALELRRQVFGDEHRMTAQTCHNMAVMYLELGSYADASILLERALSIRRKILGDQHPDTAQSKHDLARLFLKMDRLPEAEKLLKSVLQFRKEKYGEEHPDFADSLLCYCDYLSREGRFKEALPLATHVLNVRKKCLGERHPETAAAFNVLGNLNYNLEEYDEAKRCLTQSLYIRKTALGENHPATASSMHDFGRLCWKFGMMGDDTQFAEGMPLIEKSLTVRTNILGEEHPDTLQSLSSSGDLLTSLSSPEEAEPLLRAALTKRKDLFGMNHLSVAESMHALAVCLLQMGKYLEAKQLFEEELYVRSNVLGNDNPLVSNARLESQRLLTA